MKRKNLLIFGVVALLLISCFSGQSSFLNVGEKSTYKVQFTDNKNGYWQKCEFILYSDGTGIANTTIKYLSDGSVHPFTDEYVKWEKKHFHESKHNVVEDYDYIDVKFGTYRNTERFAILEDGTCKGAGSFGPFDEYGFVTKE